MRNKKLISISGSIYAGKDLVGKIVQYLIAKNNGWEDKIKNQYVVADDYKFTFEEFSKKAWNEEELSGFEIRKFADKLKDIACLLLGCTREDLEDRDFKDSVLGEEWWQYISFIDSGVKLSYSDGELKNIHKNPEKYGFELQKTTVRQFLQQLGTESLRNNLHENVHVNALFGTYRTHKMDQRNLSRWIITDTRFPNELQAVKDRGGITIRVNKTINKEGISTSTETMEHESEIALLDAEFDYEIKNDSDILSLINKVKIILENENIL